MSGLKIAVVTETHPPEVNGVAMTVGRLIEGLRGRGHRVSVLRPRNNSLRVYDIKSIRAGKE